MSAGDLTELLRSLAAGDPLTTAAYAAGFETADAASKALTQLASRQKPKASRKKAAPAEEIMEPPRENPFPPGVVPVAYADGASRGNPGPASYGCVYMAADVPLCGEGHTIGHATNNVAEYNGAIGALERMLNWGVEEAVLRLDSQLVVKQLEGSYQVKNAGLRPLFLQARALAGQFRKVRFEHVPRAQNALADRLANEALDRTL